MDNLSLLLYPDKELKDTTKDFFSHLKQTRDRPRAVQQLRDTLNVSRDFLSRMDNLSLLLDPDDQVFTEVEKEGLRTLYQETEVCVLACVCVCLHVCVVCVYVCVVSVCESVCVYVCMRVCVSVCACVCACVCMCVFVCLSVCVHVCVHVCVYAFRTLSVYVCACVSYTVCLCMCMCTMSVSTRYFCTPSPPLLPEMVE